MCAMKKRADVIFVVVGTAGIGGMQFRAWLADDTSPDESPADDTGTWATPGAALAALGRQMDQNLVKTGWMVETMAPAKKPRRRREG